MKKIIRKLPESIRYWLALIILTAQLVVIVTWPLETLAFLIIGGTIYHEMAKDWNVTKGFFIVCAISCISGLSVWGISKFVGVPEYLQVILYFSAAIYAFALVVDESHQKPYVQLWQYGKSYFRNIKPLCY